MGMTHGFQAHLSYKVGGNAGGGAYVELGLIEDVKLGDERDEQALSLRIMNGMRVFEPGERILSLEFNMPADQADVKVKAIKAADIAGSVMGMKIFDVLGNGWTIDMKIFKCDWDSPVSGVEMFNVVMKPCYSTFTPTFTQV